MSTKFRLLAEADTPTVVGKAWWNEALKLAATGDQRRNLLIAVGVATGGMFMLPTAAATIAIGSSIIDSVSGPDTTKKNALELQRTHGWSFGVAHEARTLTFSESAPDPGARQRMQSLAADLAPTVPAHTSAYVPTLFQSLTERPSQVVATEDVQGVGQPPVLADVIVPIRTTAMHAAEVDARWLRTLLAGRTAGLAVIVDLPGPDSVAFAAELADAFDPVFLFDNWPHPRGVVPAHLTLAAAIALQPRFVEMRAVRTAAAPPLFVLDRHRLNPYTDDMNQFDNRSLARVPSAAWFKERGIQRVFYVAPNHVTLLESDDLTDEFLGLVGSGVDVRALQLADYYGAANGDDARSVFNALYGFPSTPPPPPAAPTPSSSWRPAPRSSAFSGVAGTGRIRPSGFGEVPVVLGAGGVILGALYYRNGSWNRSSSSSSYGGG